MPIGDIFTAFVLGLLTPLTAVCVLPLYPGFLAFLSNKLTGKEDNKKTLILLGLTVVAGVILFMFLLGLLFTTILKVSLTNVIGIVSPIAFGFLGIVSILLIFDVDIGKFFPRYHTPLDKNPFWSSFLFGFFFGAIVVPCNPAFIIALFTRALSGMGFVTNMLSFVSFGVGIGAPLLVFAIISSGKSQGMINWLVGHKRKINLVAGVLMLAASLYYLIFVFKVFG